MFGFDQETNGPAHQWAKANNIDQNMIFHGPTASNELLDFLHQSTLLLHPALEECCPLSLIEAMSFGLPVVGGDKSGGVPWVLDFGKAGLLADVTNPEDIAEKMNYTNMENAKTQKYKCLQRLKKIYFSYFKNVLYKC